MTLRSARVAIAILGLVVGACSPTPSPSSSPTALVIPAVATQLPVTTASRAAVPAATLAAAPTPDGTLVASSDGVSVTVALASTEVAPGKPLKIAITIANARSTPLVLESQYCGAPALFTATGRIPIEPVGRTWSGLAGDLKSFALGQAEQQGEVGPTPIEAVATPCSYGGGWVGKVPAGGSIATSLTWQADLVSGVPALPDEAVLYTVSVGYDPTCSPPSGMICGTVGSRGGCVFCWGWTFQHLTLAGTFRIAGTPPKLVTAGQALDALLRDRRFATWLAKEPKSTWSIANVTLVNQGPAEGIVPAGANWEVEVFREKGVPRNWAIGFVDPRTGRLRNLTFCNIPCWR